MKQPSGLTQQLIRRLLLTVGLLVGALILSLLVSSFILNNQMNLGQENETVRQDINGLYNSMLDQERGLQSYINTADTTNLEPFTNGRPQFLAYVQDLKTQAQLKRLDQLADALLGVEQRADDWYNNYAQPQVKRIDNGEVAQAQNGVRNGKDLFDQFRVAYTQLSGVANRELSGLQQQADLVFWFSLVGIFVVALIAILFIWRASESFVNRLNTQLSELTRVTDRLQAGDLSARVPNPHDDELGRLGQNFNKMAATLAEQQNALHQRDILESATQLGNVLTNSLELDPLLDQFLKKLLQLLDLQAAALYLHDPQTGLLKLSLAEGLNPEELQPTFKPGEGLVGRAAKEAEPLFISILPSDQEKGLEIKTAFGKVLPGGMGYLPLCRGEERLGVLLVASLNPLSEKVRNVLSVIMPSLTASLSNARSYSYIHTQAVELERINAALSRQRDELAHLNLALEKSNQARNQFLSTMSHELRTPLTAIIGFSQLSLSSSEVGRLSDRQKTNLERILRNGQHLLTMINNVLELAKIEAGRMEISFSQVELKSFLPSLLDEMQTFASQKQLNLQCKIEENLEKIETDPAKLRQILANLLSNAVKYTEKGEVLVNARRTGARATDNYELVAITVKDTGMGISPEEQNRIFEEFYRGETQMAPKNKGTGLGLSIVYRLTTLLGGKLELNSSPGQGSAFTILLPFQARGKSDQFGEYALPSPSPQQILPQIFPAADTVSEPSYQPEKNAD